MLTALIQMFERWFRDPITVDYEFVRKISEIQRQEAGGSFAVVHCALEKTAREAGSNRHLSLKQLRKNVLVIRKRGAS